MLEQIRTNEDMDRAEKKLADLTISRIKDLAQGKHTGLDVWRMPLTKLTTPLFFDLEVDPGERGMEGDDYNDWWYRRAFLAVPLQTVVGKLMAAFQEFSPRQKPSSFTVQQASDALQSGTTGK